MRGKRPCVKFLPHIMGRRRRHKFINSSVEREVSWGGTALILQHEVFNGVPFIEKRLLPRYAGTEIGHELIRREHHFLNECAHPLVIQSWGVSENQNSLYLEYIKGASLADLKESLRSVSAHQQKEWLRVFLSQALTVLMFVHKRGIVHGDIAPENFMIQNNSFLKLLDFGVSRSVEEEGLSLRIEGRKSLKLPELVHSGKTSQHGDLYALARIVETTWPDDFELNEDADIRHLIEDLKRGNTSEIGGFLLNGLCPLPFMLSRGDISEGIRQVTLINRSEGSVLRWAAVILIGLLLFFTQTTFLPQKGLLSVNSRPFVHFTLESLPHQIFETPMLNMELPAGANRIHFISPTTGRTVTRQVLIHPLQEAKVFEEFR